MGTKIDLTGKTFGRLTVICEYPIRISKQVAWYCLCECGNTHIVRGRILILGQSLSCGCWHKERPSIVFKKETTSKAHPLYSTWKGMRSRCNYSKHIKYGYYGGKGISVCKEWDSFLQFVKDMGERPKGYTLDRIDSNGDYEPTNCRWASWKEQAKNRNR